MSLSESSVRELYHGALNGFQAQEMQVGDLLVEFFAKDDLSPSQVREYLILERKEMPNRPTKLHFVFLYMDDNSKGIRAWAPTFPMAKKFFLVKAA